MKNLVIKSCISIILGILIGILSKWGDVIPGDNIIKYFGWISTGVIIWLVIGTTLIIKSKDRKEFSILYSLFMLSMLIAYYIFSATVVKYIYTRIIIFWVIMFIGSLILGNIIYNKRYTNIFRILYILAAVVFYIYDAIEINGLALEAAIPELIFSILVLININKGIKINSSKNNMIQ